MLVICPLMSFFLLDQQIIFCSIFLAFVRWLSFDFCRNSISLMPILGSKASVPLCKHYHGICEHISDLVGCSYVEDLDEPLAHMLTKMVAANVDELAWCGDMAHDVLQLPMHLICLWRLCSRHRAWRWSKWLDVTILHLLNETQNWDDVTKCHWHGNSLCLRSRYGCLRLKFGSPDDWAYGIEDHPFTLQFKGTRVNVSKWLVPVAWEDCITVAFESLVGMRLEANTKVKVMCLLQVMNQIEEGFPMSPPWVRRILGNLMNSVHYATP